MPQPRRDRRLAQARLPFLSRLLAARSGTTTSESEQAALTVYDFAWMALALTAGYLALYGVLDIVGALWFLPATIALGCAQAVAIVLARRRRQLAAALTTMTASIAQVMTGTSALGWQAGLHLYLIAAGVLVFVAFTERQAAFRWVFIALAWVGFGVAQVGIGQFPAAPLSAELSGILFSFNAVVTAMTVFALSALSYYRTDQARAEAARQAAKAEYLANTDELTGLVNRRPITERLDREASPGRGGYVVAIADVDHFKSLNDGFGHQCGDRVLAHLGALLRTSVRGEDAVGRWGGEEFIVVLADTGLEDALVLMDRLRRTVEAEQITCGGHVHQVTVSIGVADGLDDNLPHRVVRRADDALYDAKTSGRNLVKGSALWTESSTPTKERRRAADSEPGPA